MFRTNKRLVLASASPRRKAYFSAYGLRFSVRPAHVDETLSAQERPQDYVRRIATVKATAVGGLEPDGWIVAADTCVVLDDSILGKPASEREALAMLLRLSGREHLVYTGYALHNRSAEVLVVETAMTRVRFTHVTDEIARSYVATKEPFDKAGGYGIQGKGGMLVAAISGSYSNVVGLPVAEVLALLLEHRVISPTRR